MNKEYKIYGLKVIGTDEIRYIGYTKRTLERRLYFHFYDVKQGFTYKKCNWIRKHNFNIEIVLIEGDLDYEQALQRETYHISNYKNLLNMSRGGEHNPMENEVVRAKHKAKMKSNWMKTKDGRELMSKRNREMWSSGVFKNSHDKFKKFISYDVLYDLYITQNKSIQECADKLNRTYSAIVHNLTRNKIRKYKKKI